MPTLKDVFGELQEKFSNPTKMKGITDIFQFEFTGGETGNYYARFDDGVATVHEGVADSPSITVFMDAGDFKGMVAGRLNPAMAFMSGKLKVKGDLSLAKKLQSLMG